MNTTQQDRRLKDTILGVLSGVCGTLAFDNLVNMLADTGMTKFRFVLFVIFTGCSAWCFLKAMRKV